MFTANTMATAIEALGMSIPYASSNVTIDKNTNKLSDIKRKDVSDSVAVRKIFFSFSFYFLEFFK
jgi:dihydroxyacid dehydratase/phosphogluconate dehydratase